MFGGVHFRIKLFQLPQDMVQCDRVSAMNGMFQHSKSSGTE